MKKYEKRYKAIGVKVIEYELDTQKEFFQFVNKLIKKYNLDDNLKNEETGDSVDTYQYIKKVSFTTKIKKQGE
jgi:hypothetical protein